jgi:hypothetical protein
MLQFAERGQYEPRPAHPQRMPERDRAAVRVDLLGVVGKPKLAQDRERLRGKRFVEFDYVDVAKSDSS